ncbi:hypothetical protein BDY19DRAFT_987768 [Irpex rosettiformis]|uniref:Uncharacterized protein n=1 Tax=Irpex rosettiformis TaxID=378272 RepID=A0ACB8TPC1_9APHY|nr:hypothetical protein BDY19DRAFT_987768 [Irpex rosettiformis]
MSTSAESTGLHQSEPIDITLEQVQNIIQSHMGDNTVVVSFKALPIHGFSAFTSTRTFSVHIKDGSPPQPTPPPTYATNTLTTEAHLISMLVKQTSVPHTAVLKLDVSRKLVPYHYLLLSSPSGVSLAQTKATLTERQKALVDLRLGMYYKQVHLEVQNDWFGLPSQEKDELYNWQEAFTYLLESLLHEAKELQVDVDIPFTDVRKYLSRAIGSFLFDDCEVPSLVSFTGDDDSIFIAVGEHEEDVKITSLIPVSHAIWGDPLLESVFINDPSPAFLEGYGGNPILFRRQRTKRLWYTLFLALVVVVQTKKGWVSMALHLQSDETKVAWARETIGICIEKLKDAPCY